MCAAADDPSPARKHICPSTSVPPGSEISAGTGLGDIQVDNKQTCRIFACFQRLIAISSSNVGTAVIPVMDERDLALFQSPAQDLGISD
jgi:hypothetical protein